MNSALKHTMVAMATAALTMSAGCKSDAGPEASETTAGAEAAATSEAAAATTEAKAEGSCGEGSCGGAKKEGEASCGEGSRLTPRRPKTRLVIGAHDLEAAAAGVAAAFLFERES